MKRGMLMTVVALSSLMGPLPTQAQDELVVRQLRMSWSERLQVSNRAGWIVTETAEGVAWQGDPITYLVGPKGYSRNISQFVGAARAPAGSSSGANAGFSFPVGIEGSGALVFVTERSSADGQAETTVSRLELNSNSPEKLFSLSKVRHRSAAVNTAGDLVVVGEVAQGAGAPIVKAYQFSRGKLSEVFSRQLPSGQEVWLADSVIDDAGNTFMSVKTLSKRSIGKSERLYAGGSISQGALTALSGAARRRLNSFDAEPFGLSAGMLLLRTNQGVRMADVTTPARFKGTKGGSRLSDRDAVQNARGGVTYLLDEPFSRPLIIREVVAGEAPRTYICRGLEKLASEALLSCVTCMTSTLTVKVR